MVAQHCRRRHVAIGVAIGLCTVAVALIVLGSVCIKMVQPMSSITGPPYCRSIGKSGVVALLIVGIVTIAVVVLCIGLWRCPKTTLDECQDGVLTNPYMWYV